ncbi:MAG: thioredoxin-like domain-containing protein [Verrucomicrobiota bacterium]
MKRALRSARSALSVATLLLGAAFSFGAESENESIREWTNLRGNTIEAEMIGFRSDSGWEYVTVRRVDGRVFEIALQDLVPSDQAYARSRQDRFSADGSASESGDSPIQLTRFEESAREHLVEFNGRRLDDWESNIQPEYYAIYYSAGWCGPCLQFTPNLVDFYDRYHDRYENFEVIFVSSDRSEDEMEAYMEKADMPWPALEFSKKSRVRELTRYSERGIPNLVVVDRDGEVLSTSYVNGSYVGPSKVLRDLEDLVKKES